MSGIYTFNFLDAYLVNLQFGNLLHRVDWRVHFQFYRRYALQWDS